MMMFMIIIITTIITNFCVLRVVTVFFSRLYSLYSKQATGWASAESYNDRRRRPVLLQRAQTASAVHPTSYLVVLRDRPLKIKQLRHEAGYSRHQAFLAKKEWSYISTPNAYAFMACKGTILPLLSC
jgi:hypothetical protein